MFNQQIQFAFHWITVRLARRVFTDYYYYYWLIEIIGAVINIPHNSNHLYNLNHKNMYQNVIYVIQQYHYVSYELELDNSIKILDILI